MRLALFDIDETLILDDSEVLWCRYLTRNDIYDMSRIEVFCQEYEQGQLDYDAFVSFQLEPLVALPEDALLKHRQAFLESEIAGRFCPMLAERIQEHRKQGHQVLVVSAAHDFLAAPITAMAGIEDGLFTMAERADTGYTGKLAGTPCFREGKVTCVTNWLEARDLDWTSVERSWFYSDSQNDLPLLEKVDHPIIVRPDPTLKAIASERGWELIA